MVVELILFIVGFIVLIKGADLLVDNSSLLARKYGVSELVIGLTIVAFGTSLPELVVNIISSFSNSPGLAIGNIIGSNIANILLILGVAAVICPLTVKSQTTYKEIPFSLLASLVLLFLAVDKVFGSADSSVLSMGDGLTLLGFFAIFLYYVFAIAKNDTVQPEPVENLKPKSTSVTWILLIGGFIGLVFGGELIVSSAIVIASDLGVSEGLLGFTVVAIGTSLPELATSAIAAYKKNTDIAIGNVIGSNIFNTFWILGISATIRPLPFQDSNLIDLCINIGSSLLLFVFLFIGKKHTMQKWQGILALILYIGYIYYLIQIG